MRSEREERRRTGGRRRRKRRRKKHRLPQCSRSLSFLLPCLFLGLLLGRLDGLEPALELAVCRERAWEKCEGDRERVRLGGEKRKREKTRRESIQSIEFSTERFCCSMLFEQASRLQLVIGSASLSAPLRPRAEKSPDRREKRFRIKRFFFLSQTLTAADQSIGKKKKTKHSRLAHLLALFVDRVLGPLLGEDVGRVRGSGGISGAVFRHCGEEALEKSSKEKRAKKRNEKKRRETEGERK